LGDFFGVGHAAANKYECLLMNMVRGSGQRGEFTGMNCQLPMPFTKHARIEVVNENPGALWFSSTTNRGPPHSTAPAARIISVKPGA
jgi:hypothetical protein